MAVTLPRCGTITADVCCREIIFFLSQSNPRIILKNFFKWVGRSISVAHSIMSVFLSDIQENERERNSVLEVLTVLLLVSHVGKRNRRSVPFLEKRKDRK
jgi:hypothetical protein